MDSVFRISATVPEETVNRDLKRAEPLMGVKRLSIRRRASFAGPPLLFPTDVEI